MTTPAAPSGWHPSDELRRWVRLCLVTFVAGSWIGFLGAVVGASGVVVLVLLAVCVYFYFHLGVLGQLSDERGLEAEERERLASQLRWFGPAGLLVLALRIRQASSTR